MRLDHRLHFGIAEMASRIFFAMLVFCSGCLSQVVPEHPSESSDQPGLRTLLAGGSFRGASFTQVNRDPYQSNLDLQHRVNMFVSNQAAAAYMAVSPDSSEAGAPFPVGGIVVREAVDDSGAPALLTIMAKQPPGYFPGSGDFFFGVTDLDGNPVSDANGPEWGPLEECAMCHRTRASAGYLFGVATADR